MDIKKKRLREIDKIILKGNVGLKKNGKPLKLPSERALTAIKNVVVNGSSKAESLREAGFSEAVATQPHKVFDSDSMRAIMVKLEMDEESILPNFKKEILEAKKLSSKSFPKLIYDRDGTLREGQISDERATEMLKEAGLIVKNIEVRGVNRIFHYIQSDKYYQLEATRTIFDLLGSYAPKKSEVKAQVAHFSLKDLRKLKEEENKKEQNG